MNPKIGLRMKREPVVREIEMVEVRRRRDSRTLQFDLDRRGAVAGRHEGRRRDDRHGGGDEKG